MKISIIPDDDVVVIDNEAILGVNTGVANDIHAIQWLDAIVVILSIRISVLLM